MLHRVKSMGMMVVVATKSANFQEE